MTDTKPCPECGRPPTALPFVGATMPELGQFIRSQISGIRHRLESDPLPHSAAVAIDRMLGEADLAAQRLRLTP